MAKTKSPPPPKSRPPLPVRVVRLHAKLVIAAIVGIIVTALLPGDWRLPTRLLVGWDVGVALYLGMMHPTILRADIARIRRRAAEQDEGAFAILVLTVVATSASLVAIMFELGGVTRELAAEAFKLASHKLPIKTKLVTRVDYEAH